jgi:hypothetical protein
MNDKLFYTFVCSTIPLKGKPVPIEGIKLISALAHKQEIPVTWIVNKESVNEIKEIINQGHSEFKDNIILMIDPSIIFRETGIVPASKAEETVILRQRLPEIIASEQERVKKALPWADAKLVGTDFKTPALVQILEELNCTGLWGYHWEGADADDIGDKGCPWSFFYASKEHYNATSPYSSKIVAVENSSLNLNAVYYTGNHNVFSANPKSLWRSGLCKDKDESYSRAILNEYLKNCLWNKFLIFIQQLDACDMQYTSYENYDGGTIAGLADITDSFFQEISSSEQIQPLSIPDAISLYKSEFGRTESCSMIFDNIIPQQIELNFFTPPDPKKKHPYPLTFFYYDSECQIIFREGQMTPTEVRNYIQPPFESKHYIEKEIPSISKFHPFRDRDKLIMEFEIESAKRMPYGLAIWDDHSMFSLVSTNARAVKWIGTYLLFMKIDLDEGLNQIEVTLAI